jgi:hypothetical protein
MIIINFFISIFKYTNQNLKIEYNDYYTTQTIIMKHYKCEICGVVSEQKSHHESHLKTKKHEQELRIKELEDKLKKLGMEKVALKKENNKLKEENEELKKDSRKIEKVIRLVGNQETIYACNKIWYECCPSDEEEAEEEAEDIIGVECHFCQQPPFGAYNRKDWSLYLHGKCGFCGEENAIRWKWGKKEEEE